MHTPLRSTEREIVAKDRLLSLHDTDPLDEAGGFLDGLEPFRVQITDLLSKTGLACWIDRRS